ncbi:MAG TPA: hypothetical protein VFC37_08810 [Terracidiphilus sp.]|nr:hypothetical protein [Terracidiphilus sp.]
MATELNQADDIKGDVILHEYQLMLDIEYPSIPFRKVERDEMIISDPQILVTASIKLHRIVDSLGQRFRNRVINSQRLTAIFEGSETEYGYYVKSKTTGQNLIWFGMWSEKGLLLGAGFRKQWHSSRSFPGFLPDAIDDWQTLSLNELLLDENEPVVQPVFERLESILESMI